MNALIQHNTLIEQFLQHHQLTTCDLRNYCNRVDQQIAIIWSIEDVHQANKNTQNRVLSNQEALHILANVERNHDATQGVSWDTITRHIADYFATEQGCSE